MTDQLPFTVLCVDDNADTRLSVSLLLTPERYRVLEAATGKEALVMAGEADLVILDVGLPDLSGVEVCRRIKIDPATSLVPVILMSGHFTGDEDKAGGLDGGGDVYLTKPADPRVLVAQVKALLRIRRAELRAVEAARRAEEGRRRLRAVTDQAPVLIVQVDAEARYVFVNRPYAARFGLTPEDVIGRRIPDVVGAGAYRTFAQHVEAALAGRRVEYEAVVPYANLGSRVVHAAYEPEFDGEGRVVGLVAAISDVTERRRAEAERDALLGRLRLHVERMPIGLVGTAPDLTLTDWNPAAERIFGFTREEALGKTCFDLYMAPDARPAVEAILRRLLAGEMEAHGVHDHRTKDGRAITCEWYNTPLVGATGAVEGLLSMVIDVTERRRLEERVRQAERLEAIGQLAGGVAHDFNNLMTVVTGYSDVILGGLPDDDPHRGPVEEVRRAGERAAVLTQQLLAFSRKQLMSARVLDLNAVVREAEAVLRRTLGSVELRTALAPDLGRIKADPAQIGQVITNLALNALDAMPRGGRLTIETQNADPAAGSADTSVEASTGPYVVMSVADTGAGMTPEVQARVFEPFFTTKGPDGGTGLGLSAVYGIVRQSGGHVEVDSEPGRGSTFRVYLPVTTAAEPGLPTGSETVLVVEAEEAVRGLYAVVLRERGYTVLAATSGADAVRVAGGHAGPIHLLVSDLVLPDTGGRELAGRLRASHPGVRVLFASAHAGDAAARQAVVADGNNFILKPFSPASLARKVRIVLDEPPGDRPAE